MKFLFALILTATLLCAAPVRWVTLQDAGNSPLSDGIGYVGPYDLRVGGETIPVLCIDFEDQVREGERWLANFTPLSEEIERTYYPSEHERYMEEAYLFSQVVKPGADRIAIQHAAWSITDSALPEDAVARMWVAAALRHRQEIDAARFVIISDVNRISPGRKQEFISAISPEPASLLVIGGLLLLFAFSIKRTVRRYRH